MFTMRLVHSKDRSIIWMCFLMKVIGLWIATNRAEQLRRNFALIYTLFALITATCIAVRDLYFSWGNFNNCVYILCNILYLVVGFFKVVLLYVHRQKFYDLIMSAERNFIGPGNDRQEQKILMDCKRLCDIFIFFITFCVQGTCAGYALTPILENIGKDESERLLPFNMWIDFPTSMSPYFEVCFTIQMLCVYHVAISYLCFDNFLCLVCLNITSQFRILQHRLTSLSNIIEKQIDDGQDLDAYLLKNAIKYRVKLKSCVRHHQALINYCRKLENVFTLIVLSGVLFLAMLLCLQGFQVFLLNSPPARRVSLILGMLAICSQLLMSTFCSDGLIRESVNVGQAAFSGPWHIFSMNKVGKALRHDVLMIILRSKKSCCLTAGGFFPVCLETCTAVNTQLSKKIVVRFLHRLEIVSCTWFAMQLKDDKDISISATFCYMKFVGFWLTTNQYEERLRKFALIYTVIALLFAVVVETRDMYYTLGNFSESIYIGCNILSLIMVLFKLLISFIYRKELYNLVIYARTNFWHSNYTPEEQAIINNCKRTCTYLICVFSFFAQGTIVGYIIRPIVENIGRNESDRMLPFNMWLDVQWLSLTPYFEIMSVLQILSLCHVGVCYLCFDNFLCIMNLHAASQFRVLQHRLTKVYVINDKEKDDGTDKYYATFKDYIKQHQMLILYCNKLEEVFNLMVLAQVLLFSLLICLDGYLVLMDDASATRRITFLFHILGCICQLLMFTYSCDCLIQESLNIAEAAYKSPWTILPVDEMGMMVRKDLLLLIMRSRVPCCLTASGFFAVSLETYTRVLSTAVSYFTLLTHY
uniref:uncharacterized protein LOC117603966 n=1 Tax=Osmia lignaria TaxID=473952 RepID=UPI001478B557|nr:uncharacterized protein LOC117603966 [Osmia lignaria]